MNSTSTIRSSGSSWPCDGIGELMAETSASAIDGSVSTFSSVPISGLFSTARAGQPLIGIEQDHGMGAGDRDDAADPVEGCHTCRRRRIGARACLVHRCGPGFAQLTGGLT